MSIREIGAGGKPIFSKYCILLHFLLRILYSRMELSLRIQFSVYRTGYRSEDSNQHSNF